MLKYSINQILAGGTFAGNVRPTLATFTDLQGRSVPMALSVVSAHRRNVPQFSGFSAIPSLNAAPAPLVTLEVPE